VLRTRSEASCGWLRLSGVTFLFIAAVTSGCDESTTSGDRDLAVPDLAEPPDLTAFPDTAVALGKCYSSAVVPCLGDWDCWGESCQEGMCCSGVLDPDTCICYCTGGSPCPESQACCEGNSLYPDDLGVACRPPYKCYPRDPG
jgi:hypothetical protein